MPIILDIQESEMGLSSEAILGEKLASLHLKQ
jgi:hypothetical protein